MSQIRLTYCGNVHAAQNLPEWLDGVARFAVAVGREQPGPFGLGAWWNADVARELAGGGAALEAVRARLEELGLSIWTLNVFPFGVFHGERVKEAVYSPDWAHPDRLRYTLDAAEAVAALAAPGEVVPMSTLPVGYGEIDRPAAARQLVAAAVGLADIEARTGVRCVLALEPEPFCVLETAGQAADYLEGEVFTISGSGATEATLRRHLGVCIDLCHLAIVREDPLQAMTSLQARGIEVPKLQVSSCLELRDPAGLSSLLEFDEPCYLHQTVADSGLRALDLPEVRDRAGEFGQAGTLRTHFHMPIFWDGAGALGSTRSEVERVLAGLGDRPPLLEVETYTWHVLDREMVGEQGLVEGLCRELAFARSRLEG